MHMMGHTLSAFYNIPHGASLSAIAPGWMRFHAPLHPARFAQFAERVFDIREGNEQEKADEGISRLTAWFQQIKAPVTISELQIPENDIEKIAGNAVTLAKVWRLKEYDTKRIEEILRSCQK
jgi:alcohol dehydrogenase YqhD (iron-dependent ADH family)